MSLLSSSNIDIRRLNRGRILRLLSQRGEMSRAELCSETGLTGAGLSRIAREMIDTGLMLEGAPVPRQGVVGRRSSRLTINPDGAYVLGLTIAANRVSVVLTNAAKQEIRRTVLEGIDTRDPDVVLNALAEASLKLVGDHTPDLARVAGAGVSVSMPVSDAAQGAVCSGVLGWKDVPVGPFFMDALNMPVKVEARSAALLREEATGENASVGEALYLINVGVGIGCAMLTKEEILTVSGRGLGGLSHVAPVGSDLLCDCGRKGCLEHTGAGAAVIRDLQGMEPDAAPSFHELGRHLADALDQAARGEAKARAAFRKAGRRLAAGIDVAQAMLHPDVIYLAGATGRQADFVEGVNEGLLDLSSSEAASRLKISAARSDAAAACIALNAFVLSTDVDLERLGAGDAR